MLLTSFGTFPGFLQQVIAPLLEFIQAEIRQNDRRAKKETDWPTDRHECKQTGIQSHRKTLSKNSAHVKCELTILRLMSTEAIIIQACIITNEMKQP